MLNSMKKYPYTTTAVAVTVTVFAAIAVVCFSVDVEGKDAVARNTALGGLLVALAGGIVLKVWELEDKAREKARERDERAKEKVRRVTVYPTRYNHSGELMNDSFAVEVVNEGAVPFYVSAVSVFVNDHDFPNTLSPVEGNGQKGRTLMPLDRVTYSTPIQSMLPPKKGKVIVYGERDEILATIEGEAVCTMLDPRKALVAKFDRRKPV